MPIRFRCAYCNQLLGISRRKAGEIVRCPTCAGQVRVPPADTAEPEPPGEGGDQPFFERSDFEELFNPAAGQPVPAAMAADAPAAAPPAGAPVGAWGTHAEPPFEIERLDPGRSGVTSAGAAPVGIVLSPTKATVLTVAVIIALALAFGAGLLVGMWMR